MKYIYFQRIRLLKNKIAAELRINGKQAGILEDANIKVGKYVENLTFR